MFASDAKLAAILTENVSHVRRRIRESLLLVGCFSLIVALAGPYWGSKLVKRPISSRDVLVVMDTSRSMLAADISPSRLKHAKWFVRNLLEQTPGDRYGLIAFAGDAFLECPLTQDRNGFLLFLNDVNTDTIPVGGTNIELALETALSAFKAAEGSHRAIVLITDGDELQGDSSAVLGELRTRNIPVFVVGIGDPKIGSFIQIEGNKFVTDRSGNRIKSKLNESSLRRIAESVGGTYVHSTVVHDGLKHIVDKVKSLVPEDQEENSVSRPIERYQIPLFLGVICFLIRMVLGERKPRQYSDAAVPKRKIAAANAVMPFVIVFLSVSQATISPALGQGGVSDNDVERSENQDPQAEQSYSIDPRLFGPADSSHNAAGPSPGGPGSFLDTGGVSDEKSKMIRESIESIQNRLESTDDRSEEAYLRYNLGVNYQLLGQREKALQEYNDALDAGHDSPELQGVTYQNLGVLKHEASREKISSDPDSALGDLNEARGYYREAMRAYPELEKIGINQELALRDMELIEEMKKLKEQLKNLQDQASEAAEEAHEQQAEANQTEDSTGKQEQQKEAQSKTQQAESAARDLEQAARDLGQEQAADWVKQAADKLDEAQKEQEQAMSPAGEDKNGEQDDHGKSAEELIRQALEQLGGKPQEKENEESDSGEQQQAQAAQDDSEKDPGDEEKKDDDPTPDQENTADAAKDGQKGESQDNGNSLENLDKLQALSILEALQDQERDLKKELKELSKQRTPARDVDKNW